MKTAYIIQHHPVEGPGQILKSLEEVNIKVKIVKPYEGDAFPVVSEIDGLVIMGGPMGVNDELDLPWLIYEKVLISEAIALRKPTLGICLGSQLIAWVLGSNVKAGPRKEVGFYAMRFSPAAKSDPLFSGYPGDTAVPLSWHKDVFELPDGAVNLASSELTECQAFRYSESTWGLLFHLEVSVEQVRTMARTFPLDIAEVNLSEDMLMAQALHHCGGIADLGKQVFDRFANLI